MERSKWMWMRVVGRCKIPSDGTPSESRITSGNNAASLLPLPLRSGAPGMASYRKTPRRCHLRRSSEIAIATRGSNETNAVLFAR